MFDVNNELRLIYARAKKNLYKLHPPRHDSAFKHRKEISHQYKFIWVRIPKAATRSILCAFSDSNVLTQSVCTPLFQLNQRYENYYKFAFVRNPWARVVSCYLNKICSANKVKVSWYFARYTGLKYQMPFDEFVEWLCGKYGRDELADPHWISQHKFIFYGDKNLVDFVGRLENFENDFTGVCKHIGLPIGEMPMLNTEYNKFEPDSQQARNRKDEYYRDFYNEQTRELIAQRYSKDISMFDYKF